MENVYLLYDASVCVCVCVWQIMPQYCKRRADVTCSVEPIEGCLSCDDEPPSPSNSCHDDTWMKARLCWTLADDVCDNVSHYVVWTCCPADSIRTASTTANTSTDPRLTSEETSSCDPGVTVPPDLDRASHGNAGLRRTADVNSVQNGQSRQDRCLVDSVVVTTSEAAVSAASLPDSTSAVLLDETSDDDVTVDLKTAASGSVGQNQCLTDELIWRCVGMTPVPSLSIEYKTLPGDGQPVMFRVQPMLFCGAVLPLINVVVKPPVR